MALILTTGAPAQAADVLINDGAYYEIDDATYYDDLVRVRNDGCPPEWPSGDPWDSCPSPGDPTEVALVDGAQVRTLQVYDSSTITMSGGEVTFDLWALISSTFTMSGGTVGEDLNGTSESTVTMSAGSVGGSLRASGTSTVTMTGGAVLDSLHATNSSALTMSGGWVNNNLFADDASTITIVGYDFEVNSNPVAYGDLTELFGRLTGTLSSGEPLDNIFYQGGGSYTGTITLIPEPSTALLLAFGLAGLAVGGRRRKR